MKFIPYFCLLSLAFFSGFDCRAGDNSKDEYTNTQEKILVLSGVSEIAIGAYLAKKGVDTYMLNDLRKDVEKANTQLGKARTLMTQDDVIDRLRALEQTKASLTHRAPSVVPVNALSSEGVVAPITHPNPSFTATAKRIEDEISALAKQVTVSPSVKRAAIENAEAAVNKVRLRMLAYLPADGLTQSTAEMRFFRRFVGTVKIVGGGLAMYQGGTQVWTWAATDVSPKAVPQAQISGQGSASTH